MKSCFNERSSFRHHFCFCPLMWLGDAAVVQREHKVIHLEGFIQFETHNNNFNVPFNIKQDKLWHLNTLTLEMTCPRWLIGLKKQNYPNSKCHVIKKLTSSKCIWQKWGTTKQSVVRLGLRWSIAVEEDQHSSPHLYPRPEGRDLKSELFFEGQLRWLFRDNAKSSSSRRSSELLLLHKWSRHLDGIMPRPPGRRMKQTQDLLVRWQHSGPPST